MSSKLNGLDLGQESTESLILSMKAALHRDIDSEFAKEIDAELEAREELEKV